MRWFIKHMFTHWGRVKRTYASKLNISGSDYGLSPGRCQASIWTNARILLSWPLGTNFGEMSIEIHAFSHQEDAFVNIICEIATLLVSASMIKNELGDHWFCGVYCYHNGISNCIFKSSVPRADIGQPCLMVSQNLVCLNWHRVDKPETQHHTVIHTI